MEDLKHTVDLHSEHLRRHDDEISLLGSGVRGLGERIESGRVEVLNSLQTVSSFMARVEGKIDKGEHVTALLVLLVIVLIVYLGWIK